MCLLGTVQKLVDLKPFNEPFRESQRCCCCCCCCCCCSPTIKKPATAGVSGMKTQWICCIFGLVGGWLTVACWQGKFGIFKINLTSKPHRITRKSWLPLVRNPTNCMILWCPNLLIQSKKKWILGAPSFWIWIWIKHHQPGFRSNKGEIPASSSIFVRVLSSDCFYIHWYLHIV